MTATRTVQLEAGVLALIGQGYRPQCDHDSCHEQARHGYEHEGGCPLDMSYVHLIAGSDTGTGGVYIEGALTVTMTPDAADEFIQALTERVQRVRDLTAAVDRAAAKRENGTGP